MMITFASIRRFLYYNTIRKRALLPLLSLLVVLFYHFSKVDYATQLKEIDLIQARNTVTNPVYDAIELTNNDDLNLKCKIYFEKLRSLEGENYFAFRTTYDSQDQHSWNTFPYNNLVYKKKKFLRERKLELKWKLSSEGLKFSDVHEQQIHKEFAQQVQLTANYEAKLIQNTNHMRVWGKCFLQNEKTEEHKKPEKPGYLDNVCSAYQRKLYPWISGKYPVFERWEKTVLANGELPVYQQKSHDASDCFMKNFVNKSNGKGIVIPVLQPDPKHIDNIVRLITVLRGLNNKLPIEITYLGELEEYSKLQLIKAARGPSRKGTKSRSSLPTQTTTGAKLPTSSVDFPQDVWFVQLDSVINAEVFADHNDVLQSPEFKYSLSTIFNSFEEYVLITPHTIPMVEDLEIYFDSERYLKHGIKLFKGPTPYSNKATRYEPGFHEISNLVKNFLMPSKLDSDYFGLHQSHTKTATQRRVFEQNVFKMMDPSLIVVNKAKVLSGLMLGAHILLQKPFKTRFYNRPGTNELNTEYIWLGQDISGKNEMTNFHTSYAVTAGTLTPRTNIQNSVTMAQELCSSSWGQVSDEDSTKLLYITTHQLENWRSDELFKTNLKSKYKQINETESNAQYFGEIPIYIESIMVPPTIREPKYESVDREPNEAWILEEGFGNSPYEYWCTYDIVGSPYTGIRGLVVEINNQLQARYNEILDLWMENRRFSY